MSTNRESSKAGRIEGLLRGAAAAEKAGRWPEAVSLLREVAGLDPGDWRTLHRLGDIHRIHLGRLREAAAFYAREARAFEGDGFEARAIAAWRLVLRQDPGRLEAHERIGALYLELGRRGDARAHYLRALAELKAAGLVREAAIVGAHLGALDEEGAGGGAGRSPGRAVPAAPPAPSKPEGDPPEPPDADAEALAAERFQDGRLFHHYGMHAKARERLEQLLMIEPGHLEGRRLLVEVCRTLGDQQAASEHFQLVTRHLREQVGSPQPVGPAVEPAAASDPLVELDLDLDPEPAPVETVSSPRPSGRVAPEQRALPDGDLFASLKREIERVVAGEDAETRYSLGLALREMGLLDEAIVEFQQAARDPRHFYACASMLGLCLLEKGFPQLAVRWLEKGLAVPGRSLDEYQGIRYDLARAAEAAGDRPRAIALLTELYGEDAGYRDVAERLRRLLAEDGRPSGGDRGGSR